jgi:hypothetical protein
VAIHFAYELFWAGNMAVDVARGPLAGRVVGEYPDARMSFANVNATWKF